MIAHKGAPRQRQKGESIMDYVERVLEELKARNPGEPEFHQAATEILNSQTRHCKAPRI